MEIGTGLTVLGAALGGKDFLLKLLGPTADYLGEEIKLFAKKRIENVKKILINASAKSESLDPNVQVSPRVLKSVLDEGSYVTDELFIQYFGGVLASSKSRIKRDDRAVSFNSLLGRLTTYQLRFHYVVYNIFHRLYHGQYIEIGYRNLRLQTNVFIPFDVLEIAMDLNEQEMAINDALIRHCLYGTAKDGLIEDVFIYGDNHRIKEACPESKSGGFIISVSLLGLELFSVMNGYFNLKNEDFLLKNYSIDPSIIIPDGSLMVRRALTDLI